MKRNVFKSPTRESLQREIADLERKTTLWSNPEFQSQFVQPVEAQMEKLRRAEWITTNEELRVVLGEMGVSPPQNPGDLLTLFMCARSVVASWEKRLRPFRDAEGNLNSLKKELTERERTKNG